MLHLETGCNYCQHLKCTDKPKSLLQNFKCKANKKRKIQNAGAYFTEILTDVLGEKVAIIIQNCEDFI